MIHLAYLVALDQVTLRASINGQDLGRFVVSQQIEADGGKRVETRVENRSQTTWYDSKGAPLRIEVLQTGKPLTTVTFDRSGAVLEGQVVALIERAPRNNPSEFWFLRDQPKVGAEVTAYTFRLNPPSWMLTRTRYIGPEELAGRRLHHVRVRYSDRIVDSWLDAKGLPVRLVDDQGLKMDREEKE